MATEFQELIRKAIGPNRTQSEFAKEAGLTPQYLNRLLNSDTVGKPTKTTLTKIAGHSFSGIPLATFMKACGYENTEDALKDELRKLPIKDRIQRCVDAMIDGFYKLSENHPIYNSLYDFTDAVLMLYDEEDISASISEPRIVQKGELGQAEKAAIVTLSWDDDFEIRTRHNVWDGFAAELDILVCYSETTGGSVIIFDVKADQKTLMKYQSDIVFQLESMDEYRDDGKACIIRYKAKHRRADFDPNDTAEERLLKTIFGDSTEKSYPIVDAGPGFYIDETPPYVFIQFIENHKDSLSEDLIERHNSLKDKLTDDTIKDLEENEAYPSYLISSIIQKETGLHTESNCDFKFESNRLAVIFPAKHPWSYSDSEREMSKATVERILDKYARELRSEVEFCHNIWEAESDYFE